MVNINLGFGRAKVAAVVDVAPGGATVAIITSPKDAAATILSVAVSALTLEPRTEAQSKTQIGEQVKEAAAQASKLYASAGHKGAISDVYVIVHAPWAKSTLVTAAQKSDVESRVTEARIGALAKEALASSKEVDSTKLLEASVIHVELNGYPTSAPEGKSAHELRITSILSDCEPDIRASIEAAVQQYFPVARIAWRSGIRALMTLARESHLDRSFLLVDMGVDDTHVVAYHGAAIEQLVIPEGTRTILARIAAKRPAEEVLGYLRMLSRDACSAEACDALRQAIATSEPELVRAFGEAIGKIGATNRVPNDVLLLAHPDLSPWLSSFLTRIDFAQFTLTSLPLSVFNAHMLDIGQWVAGAESSDAATVGAALVNIESRA